MEDNLYLILSVCDTGYYGIQMGLAYNRTPLEKEGLSTDYEWDYQYNFNTREQAINALKSITAEKNLNLNEAIKVSQLLSAIKNFEDVLIGEELFNRFKDNWTFAIRTDDTIFEETPEYCSGNNLVPFGEKTISSLFIAQEAFKEKVKDYLTKKGKIESVVKAFPNVNRDTVVAENKLNELENKMKRYDGLLKDLTELGEEIRSLTNELKFYITKNEKD